MKSYKNILKKRTIDVPSEEEFLSPESIVTHEGRNPPTLDLDKAHRVNYIQKLVLKARAR